MKKLYFSDEERRRARRVQAKATRELEKTPGLHDDPPVPPEVREAQRRKIEFMLRALGRMTPNHYFLADPIKSRSVSSSLSATEIAAILGPL